MDGKVVKNILRLVIVSILILVTFSIVISILLFKNARPSTQSVISKLELISTANEIAPSAQEVSAVDLYDSRLPKVPVNECSSEGWPIDITFSRKYDVTLCSQLDDSDYQAVYIDIDKYLRVAKNGSVQVSCDKGTKWQEYETDVISSEDFLYWMAIHEAPGMTGYSIKEMIDRIENGASVIHSAFSYGNEIYFVKDDIGVYLIPHMLNKIESIWIDGQRMTITSKCHPYIISEKTVQTFYKLLVSNSIASQDKIERDYASKMEWFRRNNTVISTVE